MFGLSSRIRDCFPKIATHEDGVQRGKVLHILKQSDIQNSQTVNPSGNHSSAFKL